VHGHRIVAFTSSVITEAHEAFLAVHIISACIFAAALTGDLQSSPYTGNIRSYFCWENVVTNLR